MVPIRFLHLHSTFAAGGKELRAVRLMGAFRGQASHRIASAVPGAYAAADLLPADLSVEIADDLPLAGRPSLGRLRALAEAMRGHDLVLTYNWGAADAVMAHRLFARALRLPPLIHHEDGFNADEAVRQKRSRVAWRRLALPTADRLVVPSGRLEQIARRQWRQPAARVLRIPNGVPVARFADDPAPGAIPGLARRPGEIVVGTMAGLRTVKNLPRLVRAFAASGIRGRLVIVGDGPERGAILAEAERLGIADCVLLPGFLPDPARYVGLFDIFALSSESEQFPISAVEAMAAGLPVASTDVGDLGDMVAPSNRRFVVADEFALAGALSRLAADHALRRLVGADNRDRARRDYDERTMIARYAVLYGNAAGRDLAAP